MALGDINGKFPNPMLYPCQGYAPYAPLLGNASRFG